MESRGAWRLHATFFTFLPFSSPFCTIVILLFFFFSVIISLGVVETTFFFLAFVKKCYVAVLVQGVLCRFNLDIYF